MTQGIFKTYNSAEIAYLQGKFCSENFVYLTNFLTAYGYKKLKNIERNFSAHYMKKEFLMPQSNYSPRKLKVIGGQSANSNTELTNFYRNIELTNFISNLVQKPISECDELIENIIFTTLSEEGDTHGWHFDDYPIALIICLETPGKNDGGEVEFYNVSNKVTTFDLKKCDAYLMRSDLLQHRVRPLKTLSLRTIVNFTYSFPGFEIYPNGSAPRLCD